MKETNGDIMKFVKNLDKLEYEKFVKKSEKSHFLQSYAWGEFSKASRGLIPHYVGLKNDKNKLVATALLLQKKLPKGYSYFYSPRGFVIDFYDKETLEVFTKEVLNYTKEFKSIFLKIDPDIEWKKYDYLNNPIELEKDPQVIFDTLTKLGFKHLGFTKNFETMQPRYTFRIDMNQSLEEIENRFSKTTKQRIKKAISLNTKVRIGTREDLTTFDNLMKITENRKDFVSHDLDYYEKLFDIYNKDNKFILFMGSVDLEEITKKYKTELDEYKKELDKLSGDSLSKSENTRKKELLTKIESHQKLLEQYESDLKEYGSEITLNAHAIIEYANKAWVIYAGNHNILTSTYSNYKTYEEHIKHCHEQGIKMYDQFGTIGDLSKDNPRLGLHEFKKKFGGDYVEFIGEFDFITNKLMYFIFTKLVPIYRRIIRNRSKKEIKNGISKSK